MRVRIPVLLALALLAGCAHRPAGRPSPPDTGVRGTVVVQPSCPSQSLRSLCMPRPWQGTVEATDAAGTSVGGVATDESGSFELPLEPGTYTIAPRVVSGQGKIATVTVPSAGFATVTLFVDVGIR